MRPPTGVLMPSGTAAMPTPPPTPKRTLSYGYCSFVSVFGTHSRFALHVSFSPHAGLHPDTHSPSRQTKPARHSGRHATGCAGCAAGAGEGPVERIVGPPLTLRTL